MIKAKGFISKVYFISNMTEKAEMLNIGLDNGLLGLFRKLIKKFCPSPRPDNLHTISYLRQQNKKLATF